MAYIKRDKYIVINDNDVKKELLKILKEKGIQSTKAKELVFYPRPMSLIRWSNYLEPDEMDEYLELYVENEENMGF